jgi:uncharacterized hydrophobic protein (TIGR00271 family)
MKILARFQAIKDDHKALVVRKLMESSTLNFDFLYLTGLSVIMATLGLIVGSPAIVIGSMLIAPVLYPILGIALGLVMSNASVLGRSALTLVRAFAVGIVLAVLTTLLFGEAQWVNEEILLRVDSTLLSMAVAVIAGLAVSYALAQPEWSETLPGIAISVSLIPPLAVVGIGIAWLDPEIILGSLRLLGVNVVGIIFAAMVSFSLMDLHEKGKVAESTIKREEDRKKEEEQAVEEIIEENKNNNRATYA